MKRVSFASAKTDTSADMVTTDNWLVANINTTGFYRVNYDSANWERLLDTLSKTPEVRGRAGGSTPPDLDVVFSSTSRFNSFASPGDSSHQPSATYRRCI